MNYLHPCPKPERKIKERKPGVRKVTAIESNPLEETEQITVTDWLKAHKVLYQASMMGAYLHPTTFNRMKRMGCVSGFPDIMVYQKPPAYGEKYVGVGLELKRRKGGIVSDEQRAWLENLNRNGWLVGVMRGADAAIEFLERCGYGGKKSTAP